jgi:hypothetical protein
MHGRRGTVLIVVASTSVLMGEKMQLWRLKGNEAATCACAIRLAILTATFLVIRFMSKDIAIIVYALILGVITTDLVITVYSVLGRRGGRYDWFWSCYEVLMT